MERIKKALELAREQREALAKGQSGVKRAAVPDVTAKTDVKKVKPEPVAGPKGESPPVLTEIIDSEISAKAPVEVLSPADGEASVSARPMSPSSAHESLQNEDAAAAATPSGLESDFTAVDDAQDTNSATAPETEPTKHLEPEPLAPEPDTKERFVPLKSAVPSGIRYSQTRQVDVSAEQMEANRLIAGIKNHPHSDLFRVLRTKILHRMRTDSITSLAVTSPTKGAGKSMVSANLAVSLAMEVNQTVMLVDLDLRKPAISRYFGIDTQHGVADYLIDNAELPGLLVHPGIDRLVLLPAGNPVPQSSELLSTPRMSHLVEDITNRYASRIVLFDLPPLLHLDDALIFLPQVQASLLVVEEGVNSAAEVEQSLRLLEKSNLLGTVYNKARIVKHSPY